MSPGSWPYIRFPHVRGDVVTFVADDAVWLVPLAGGRATRLTGGRERVAAPRLSPDGTRFAWTAWAEEQPEVYVSDVDGGTPRRLTYWGGTRTATRGWTPDGRVLTVSDVGQPATTRTFAYALPVDGSPAATLAYGWVDEVAYGPGDEVLVATAAGVTRELAWWKRYRGGTAARLWISPGDGAFTRLLPDHAASLVHPMYVEDRILVVTDHEGSGRLYCLDEGRTRLAVVAEHEFYLRHATTDGRTVVYVAGGDLFALDAQDAVHGRAQPRRLDVTLGGVRAGREPRVVDLGGKRAAVAVDRTGRASAVEARGTVQWLPHRDGPARALQATSGVRARVPVVAGDRVVFVTDAGGEDALEVVDPDGTTRRLAAGLLGRVLEAAASPDGAHLAVASHDGRLSIVDLHGPAESGDLVREVARATEGEVTGLAWSPDSAWLAWSHPGPEPLRHVRLVGADGSGALEATPLRFTDTNPVFTADGLHLVFLSVRSLDPVYDAFSFDLAFPGGARPHLLPLAARTPSPFAAEVGGRPSDGGPAAGRSAGGGPEQEAVAPTVVDVEGLAERVVPFPVPAGRYRDVRVVEGGVVWLHLPAAGELGDDLPSLEGEHPRPALERFHLGERRLNTLVEAVDEVWASGDGTRLVVADGPVLRVLPADHRVPDGPDGDKERVEVDLSRLRLHLDPVAEWHQMFDEAGRLMRENFWRPDLVGEQWDAVLDRYRPLVDRLGSHDDLVDLLWEVQGELGTSHAFVSAPPRQGESRRRQGRLGADLALAEDGTWQVVRVLPGESSEPRARSPLTAPGVDVRAGDEIVAVDGRPVPSATGAGELLAGTGGMAVELTVRRAGETRRVAVTPTSDETPLRYQHWVADRRAFVRDRSGGRLGYLHVPDMMSTGWAQLHRDLRLEMAREGLVVDLRENRGGHTSQLVIGILARRVVGWDLGRGYSPAPYPLDGPRGAVVAVADEWAGSDGDIVTAAIQALGIAPVVGMRTWGGVVGIDAKYRLVDGTGVTQPRFAFWLEGKGWGVENHGVDPDVEVEQSPTDRSQGRDPQLEEAVRLALEELERRPAARPPALPGDSAEAVDSGRVG
jgi:tricorn protease